MKIQDLLKPGNDDGSFLFNDRRRAIRAHKLMQWAKLATFGLYIVAVFMLYVADVWGIGSFIEKNSNEYVALGVFSFISFVLAYFLASSKEAVYEDIAIHRSEGWKLTAGQKFAMALFLSSGVLFEMFSTTNNQQHIANTAAEQSTMMKSIQGTDVSVLGSTALTSSLQQAQMRLASCRKKEAEMQAKGKKFDCVESEANLAAVKESMAMSNKLAHDSSAAAMSNKIEGMLKVREHFDKPMFQAIGKATGTDNNSGMMMVVGVLIFIFELQHILSMFAYSNALRALKSKQDEGKQQPAGNGYNPVFTPSPTPSSNPVTPFQAMKDELRGMVDNAPAAIANEYAMAQQSRQQVYSKAADKLDAIQGDLNQAKADKTYRAELREGEKAYSDTPLDKPRPAPRLSVEATVKQIQQAVKASGATSPEAIQAAVFDSFAAMPNTAPLGDVILNKLADKLAQSLPQDKPKTLPQDKPDLIAEGGAYVSPAVSDKPKTLPQDKPDLTDKKKQALSDAVRVIKDAIESGELTRATFPPCKELLKNSGIGNVGGSRQELISEAFEELTAMGLLSVNPEYDPASPKSGKQKYLICTER